MSRNPDRPADPIELEIFKHLFAAVAEEMGARLMRSAYSPNIKERRDFSCAVFDEAGAMVAQAAHIPVHLGSTPMSVAATLEAFAPAAMRPGDRFVLNDPFAGGTHLPDLTVIAPCFLAGGDRPAFFLANRAHHADVGGIAPGSLPLSTHIDEEGIRLPPMRLDDAVIERIAGASRTPAERRGDLWAQRASLEAGIARLGELAGRFSAGHLAQRGRDLQDYTERLMRQALHEIPDGVYAFEDVLDDDGFAARDIAIRVTITVAGDGATVDFRGSADQVRGPVNAVRAITVSAVNYVFRCLAPEAMPSNAGLMRPLAVVTRAGSVVDAVAPAAVAAGNVETSQRIVDVLLGALAQASPERVPAASCGSMNNVTIGGVDPHRGAAFAYYETIAGGAGAGPAGGGGSAIHTHMTNTLNTPVEALEHAYPFRVSAYAIRRSSGGRPGDSRAGFAGGDGIVRQYVFAHPVTVTLMTERRAHAPYGLNGGGPGATGVNELIHPDGRVESLAGKMTHEVVAGSRLQVCTPGGGAWS